MNTCPVFNSVCVRYCYTLTTNQRQIEPNQDIHTEYTTITPATDETNHKENNQ